MLLFPRWKSIPQTPSRSFAGSDGLCPCWCPTSSQSASDWGIVGIILLFWKLSVLIFLKSAETKLLLTHNLRRLSQMLPHWMKLRCSQLLLCCPNVVQVVKKISLSGVWEAVSGDSVGICSLCSHIPYLRGPSSKLKQIGFCWRRCRFLIQLRLRKQAFDAALYQKKVDSANYPIDDMPQKPFRGTFATLKTIFRIKPC